MSELLFNDNMRLSDLILTKPNLILMLPRFNIHLGFGDKSVKSICIKYGISPDFFLLICNVYSFNNYIPAKETVISTDMSFLVNYLKASHDYYTGKRLPHIASHLNRIAAQMNSKLELILKHFFGEYNKEVLSHFSYEEDFVFPHIKKLMSGIPDKDFKIGVYRHNHTNIEDKLDDLTQIVFKYLPEGILLDEVISVVFDILQLSEDLKKHSMVEEKILVPYVEHLEKSVR